MHAALLTTTRARMEAFVEWAWDYFAEVKGDQVLDRFSQAEINWNDDAECQRSCGAEAQPQVGLLSPFR